VNTRSRHRKTNLEIKKPYAVVQYNKFMKAHKGLTSTLALTQFWRKLKTAEFIC